MKYLVLFGLCGALTLSMFGLSSCSKKGGSTHVLRDGKGGKHLGGTFYTNETGDLRSLDPPQINDETSSHIGENIYDELLAFDKDLKLKPSLSALPEISTDGLTYTFHLRTDAYFQDDACFPNSKGRKFVAQDVVYCWTRACDPRTNTLAYPYFQVISGAKEYFESKGTIAGLKGLQAPNDSTVVITLIKPFSPFISYSLLGNSFIYPHEAVEKYGKDFTHHGVGTGPFRFVEYKESQYCLLVRNEHYWGKDDDGNQLPYLDTVKFSFMKDNKTELLSFKQGKLDHVYRIPAEFFQDVVDENKNPRGEYKKYQIIHLPSMASQFYGFNTRTGVSNVHLRRAFAFAIDRTKIIKYVLKGQAAGPGIHGIVPPSMPGYPINDVYGFTFNLDSAKHELALAMKELNNVLPDVTLQLNSGGSRNEEVAQAIQSQLSENLGVKVKLQLVEWAQHTAMIDEGKAKFFRLGWIADYPDPQNFLNLLYGKNIPASGPSSINSTRYSNPEVDTLYDQAIAETDRTKINALWARAESLAMYDAPMLVLYYDEDYHTLQPNVRDFPANAMNRIPLKATWFSD
jgi:oligopeptide transport system substrate-binding protein